ncbi:MAG: hypothetical protein LBW77_05550 [Verrucomicrobiota bacterium]|jgi:hypothetical protein|nr:hypothetical protein [Verrucomicrobiota bacterium]
MNTTHATTSARIRAARGASLLAGLIALAAALPAAAAQSVTLVADNYNVTENGRGFALGEGINTGINPPASNRLTGTVAAPLRYIYTQPHDGTDRDSMKYGIGNNRLRVIDGGKSGRFALSADGYTPFNFAPSLGSPDATPANPVVYDVKITIRNDASGTQRASFGISTADGDVTTWSFGVQLVHATTNDTFYAVYRRIDSSSAGVTDINAKALNTAPNTYKTPNAILLRVTDAGAESGAAYHSRVQLSLDNGTTWAYDTATDAALPNGFRFGGAGRVFVWDQAANDEYVYYDNFSVARQVTVSAAPVSPADGTLGVGQSAALSASASSTLPGNLTVTFYGRETPQPYPSGDFTIAVLPDTQNYARESSGNGNAKREHWFAQTDWLVSNHAALNIVYVAHLGDVVQSGDIKNGKANNAEWNIARDAMYRLENATTTGLPHGIPYGIVPGNHDQEPMGDPDGTTTLFNQHFGVTHFNARPWYGDHFGDNNDSHYDLFSVGGLNFIVVYFEFGRSGTAVLNWAKNALAAHPSHRAIAVTHYAGSDKTPSAFSGQGSKIYNALKDSPNFFMLLGGHVAGNGGEGSRTDTYQGRTVRTFISDFQGWMNGGNGFLRLITFSPANNRVTIKTYSPWLNEYRTDANSQLTFAYNMALPSGPGSTGTPYVVIASNTGVAQNQPTTAVWTGLKPKTEYDWYVKATDQTGNTVTSGTRSFTTLTKFAPNTPPAAVSGLLAAPGDAPVAAALQAADPDGDPLTFELLNDPQHGLVTDFNPLSGAFTYLPVRGYRGTDPIVFRALDGIAASGSATLTIRLDDPPDLDGNGLPDAWETLRGVHDPFADGDGDGADALAEYLAGTNPADAGSVFVIHTLNRTEDGVELSWKSVGGARYRVQVSDDSPGGPYTDLPRPLSDELDTAPYGEPSEQSYTDEAPGAARRFYRIKLVQ